MKYRMSLAPALALLLAACQPAPPPAAAEPPNPYAALAKLPDWGGVWEVDWANRRGSPRAAPPKLTPEYEKKLAEIRKAQQGGEYTQGEAANCVPPGVPGIMSQPYPIEFLYLPGKVVMLTEAYMQYRHIWTDGRKPPEDPDLTFNGTSIGRWEGDTLVVETYGLNTQNLIDGRMLPGIHATEGFHVTERIRRVDPDWMEIQMTLTDPDVLAEPYTTTVSYRHLDDEIREYMCLENNRDSADEKGRPGLRLE